MPTHDVCGVPVNFPFEPYECQVDYMTKVVTCLQKSQNGALESPTGTGKTLSLLCASLAWQESRKAQVELNKQAGIAAALSSSTLGAGDAVLDKLNGSLQTAAGSSWGSDEFFVPRIIYASRTHSQLSQAVQELKKTTYNHVKTSVIGSREQLCIHPQVQKATSNAGKVQMCRLKVASRQCHYYNNIDEFKKKSDLRKMMGSVVDIEDIVKVGHKSKTCPYYMARELKSDSDIVFMPYNYLLDAKSRKAHGVELQGSVIIFDEAHNLEKICEESASFDLSSMDLATAIEETTKLAEKVAEMCSVESMLPESEDSAVIPEFNLEDVVRLKKTLLEIEEKLEEIDIPSADKGKTLNGTFIFELLSQVNINWSTKNVLLDVLDKMTNFLGNDDGSSILNTKGAGLSKVADCLKIVFSQEPRDSMALSTHEKFLAQHFKVHIQQKDPNNQFKKNMDSWSHAGNSNKKAERILSYWCFSPGHTMKDLLAHGVKVIILTSGTLSPLDSFAMEMQIPFPVRLENPHVIEKDQVWLGTVCKGPDGVTLNSEYKNRNNEDYQNSLGYSIRNFARIVPNGLLVFFPSYPVMERCIEKWKASNLWNVITQYKPILVEPKGKAAFNEAMIEFYDKVHDPALSGAIFMAVCRGKVSEGLDFADNNGRAVLITGLPFPPIFDPRVRLKMDFLRENKKYFKGLDGNAWYKQQATRAVNQAIGRVIRHKKDYGAIILCDTRFSSESSKNSLPKWVRGHAQVYTNFGPALRDVIKFFKDAEKAYPLLVGVAGSHPGRRSHMGHDEEGGVISGACFEPSFSRRSNGKGHLSVEYEPASSVACHIPGLKSSDDGSLRTLNHYSQRAKPEVKIGKKRSLLEALESMEPQVQSESSSREPLPTSQIPSYQPPKKKLPGKQKKIRIKDMKPKVLVTMAGENSNQPTLQQMKRKMSLESSQNYLVEVKAATTTEAYKRFSDALVKYKTNHQIMDVLPVLADVFTSSEQNYHLFQKFFRFVRSEDKPHYAKVCLDLTGLVCEQSSRTTSATNQDLRATTSTNQGSSSRLTQENGEKTKEANKESCQDTPKNASGSEADFSTCRICHKKPEQGLRHECGAVCCFMCWKTAVFDGPEDRRCPYPPCTGRVKRKHLQIVAADQGVS
ncbi:regulator of telomere elongation helicase 1 isoform X2 [Aplysia californica]|uniref:Regulator of telomere elongation helicase 1 homolog n=1 Tax=Aplysia californica TaxID=6500 RepID=A0ABM1VTF1_APLCA|nr:regulator of telomere elongation helicase 1 isoform X2 [Aplysia californica]